MIDHEKQRNQILFDFESLIDLKLGLIALLKEQFKKGDPNGYINVDHLYNTPDEAFQSMRMISSEDVIHYVFQKEAQKQYEQLTKKYMEEYYEAIMYRSPLTAMVKLIYNYHYASKEELGIKAFIFCTKDVQVEFCKKYLKEIQVVTGKSRYSYGLDDYGSLVVSYIEQAIEFGNNDAKNFYVLNYRENFEPDDPTMPKIKIISAFGDTNSFNFYEAYSGIEPKG